jgi:hypothetical protein
MSLHEQEMSRHRGELRVAVAELAAAEARDDWNAMIVALAGVKSRIEFMQAEMRLAREEAA